MKKYDLIFTKFSKDDLQEIVSYYDSISYELSNYFLDEIENEIDVIESQPQIFQIRYKNIRVSFLKVFPYGIHFEIKENLIIIKAIFHTSRSTKKIKKR